MLGNFEEDARKIIIKAKKEMMDLNHPYVGSEHLLLAILSTDNSISKKLKQYDLDYNKFKEEIIRIIGVGKVKSNWFLCTALLRRVIDNAIMESHENNDGKVTVEHLFSSLLEEGEGVAIRILIGMNIDIEELYQEFSSKIDFSKKKRTKKKLLLEEIGVDLTKKAMNHELDPVIGREKELKRVLEILSRRTKNNPILIGEAGVGKTAIVEQLANMIVDGDVPLNLRNKRIISLDMASTVAGTKYRGEFEERINKILKEIEYNDDIILFIDEIHTLVGAGGAEGAIDASNIFKPALARGKLRCIGATTIDEYKQNIEKDGALDRRFQKVNIEQPSKDAVKDILMHLKNIYEQYHYVTISEEMIDLIISLSEKYIYDRNEPDRTIDILDEVCAKVSLKESRDFKNYNRLKKELEKTTSKKNKAIIDHDFNTASHIKEQENQILNDINLIELKLYKKNREKVVTKDDIIEVISSRTKIPIYEENLSSAKEIEKLKNKLSSKIIGQKEAIKELITIAKKIKLGLKEEKKPYSILFVGPSGVGKTMLSKEFAKEIVGENVIKLDMSEYIESNSVSKIIGAAPGYVGYDDHNNILEEIRNKPYSILILDEIEKANQTVINLFYQILDEGKIKNSVGKTIRFDNVTIIMTSNVGFDEIKVGFNKNEENDSSLKESFPVPFLNRIDSIVTFNQLKRDDIEILIKEKLNVIKNKYKSKNIKIKYKSTIYDEIIKLSNYEEFGARKLDKVIKDKVDSLIVDSILEGNEEVVIDNLVTN